MKTLKIILIILSFIMLSAHFSRAGEMYLSIISLLLPFLMTVKKPFSARILQTSLLAGSAEWIFTMYEFVIIRQLNNQPYLRLMLILSLVAVFTAFTAYLFQTKELKTIYKIK